MHEPKSGLLLIRPRAWHALCGVLQLGMGACAGDAGELTGRVVDSRDAGGPLDASEPQLASSTRANEARAVPHARGGASTESAKPKDSDSQRPEGGTPQTLDAGNPVHVAPVHTADAATPKTPGTPTSDSDTPAAHTADAHATDPDAGPEVMQPSTGPDSGVPSSTPHAPDADMTSEPGATGAVPEPTLRVITQGLQNPWEISLGPEGLLWITERVGKRVLLIDPATGSRRVAFDVPDVYQSSGQDGLLGLAWDPQLLQDQGEGHLYVAYTYAAALPPALDRRIRIVRYTYDAAAQSLVAPETVIEGFPASNDHNSGRLRFGPDAKLYYAVGDQGRNQFGNRCLPIQSQVLPTQAAVDARDYSSYQGKVLRINLDGSIPEDNPQLEGVRSHIFSYGHRNPQGLVFAPDGTLYSSEHGPKTDDEVNQLHAGKNYGWPHVAGYQDDKAYVYGEWYASSPTSCEDLPFSDYVIPDTVPVHREHEWSHPDFVPPLATFFTVDDDYDFQDPDCSEAAYICWPTIAPSSIDFVTGEGSLASWGKSLLVTSLKQGAVYRLSLDEDGQAEMLWSTTDRYRDIAVAANGRTFYVVTDNDGPTSGPTSGISFMLEHPGAVLELSYSE